MTTRSLTHPPGVAPGPLPPQSIVLGILSVTPIACCAVAVASWIVSFAYAMHAISSLQEPTGLGTGFTLFGVLLVLGAVTTLAAIVAQLADVFTNPRVGADRQVPWLLVLLFANVFGFPVYWYVVHWRARRDVSAAGC